MKKLCSGCRKELITLTESRCTSCKEKLARDRPKVVSNNESFYKSNKWKKLSKYIIQKYNGLDLYELLVNKRIVKAKVVHHIIPVEDDFSRRFDEKILIPLSIKTHMMIENLYKTNKKKKTQELLFKLLEIGIQ